ncbi:MAG: acyltransferase [Proteobacteria bacterium]|nr:acyltransferase [Pseudomonadota bacterium]
MLKKEYYILNVLRGLSALFVLFYHFFVFFFAHPDVWFVYLQVEPLELPQPFYLEALTDFPVDIGHLGVSYFFLISGFLIHASLQRYDSFKAFIIHKVLRLWPTYFVCFALGLLSVAFFNYLLERPFPFTWDHVLACFFWMRDILNYPYIDGAVWTLEIQIKFYIFAILVWCIWKKKFLDKVCLLAVLLSFAVYGVYYFTQDGDYSWFYLVLLARRSLKFFMLLLLGTCIYSYFKKEESKLKIFFLSSILLLCFLSPLFSSPSYSKTVSYLLGFVSFFFFVHFYAQRMKLEGRLGKSINWVSDISYPLYIGHVLPGYMIMYYMIEMGYNVYLGILFALIYLFPMATIVHRKIEIVFEKIMPARPKSG